jgi:diacylglycerol kinase (ATP)
MSAHVILNPYSARWKAKARAQQAQAALREAGVEFSWSESQGPGECTRLAREAASRGDQPIIVAGGDGTIGEVINGLAQAQAQPRRDHPAEENEPLGPLGILPMGTANDLCDNLGIPRDLGQAARVIAAGQTRVIDLGSANGQLFANNSAVGLEPVVSMHNIELVWLRGVVRYLVAALWAIWQRPSWHMDLDWQEGSYSGRVTLVSVGNCQRTGGLFFMTPNAKPDDGMLDFVFAPALSRLALFRLLPMTFNGSHIHDPRVRELRTQTLRIRSQTPTPLQTDGELSSRGLQEVTYQIHPRRLRLLVPTL